MRAMVVTAFGPADHLKMMDVPDPTPGEHDLLVEVHAAAVNPVDYKVRQTGLRLRQKCPIILGYDASGVVRAVGSKVQTFNVGDEVYASPSLGRDGANAQLVCVDARTAALKPRSLDHAHAAALPLVTLTAWESLHDRARLHTGETVLIHAGGGGVGHVAIQLAKLHGNRVITTAGRDESIDLCTKLGADVVINYRTESFVQRVEQETNGTGCDVVLETVGGDVFEQSLDCVAVNGRIVSIVGGNSPRLTEALFFKNASLHYEFMGTPTVHGIRPQSQGEILRTVCELVDAGKLKPHVSRTFTLEQLPEAHRLQESGHTVGKIAVQVR
ncbi:MAG: zinc-binding dehydrogenase [Phycisphaeraceae bacterium]